MSSPSQPPAPRVTELRTAIAVAKATALGWQVGILNSDGPVAVIDPRVYASEQEAAEIASERHRERPWLDFVVWFPNVRKASA